jgi:hypothetical protein
MLAVSLSYLSQALKNLAGGEKGYPEEAHLSSLSFQLAQLDRGALNANSLPAWRTHALPRFPAGAKVSVFGSSAIAKHYASRQFSRLSLHSRFQYVAW